MTSTTLSLDGRLPGHAGALTGEETHALKNLWLRLYDLFKQPGTKDEPKKTENATKPAASSSYGFFGFGAKKEEPKPQEVFLGTTTNTDYLSLPLDQAIGLIPGAKLEACFWNLVATDNPDATLLRFLRARKWDADAAYRMLMNCLRWRIVNRVDDIVALGETGLADELERLNPGTGESFLEQLHSRKATLGGPDNHARGVCFVNVARHHKEEQSLEVMKLLTMYILETSRLFGGHPSDTVCICFNLENFTMANMDFDFIKFLVTCLEAYYPETLGLCIVHKAPWVFSTVWTMITPLLDPVVASKIRFTKTLDQLTEFIAVDNLPKAISGKEDNANMDEKIQLDERPAPGPLNRPETPAIEEYKHAIEKFKTVTQQWAQNTSDDDDQGTLARLSLACSYRAARIKAEPDLRGPTMYHVKKMVTISDQGRLLINLCGKQEDTTERV
ncbi:CRAL-TRIO domain-containing protein [Radiomyces spectabilis]|uniref:CRAL-TRIO domain-containing protein n=1 Tax=Radiomyces spectabilis TaxID=64574 RepID=UPI00221F1968|nr:CRAL-TRIO domain-containing protein [Radiomyces spectabilis]KAI8391322.1 CRAL-TRIO domain-containing protein [Radiomyces spectabilis]